MIDRFRFDAGSTAGGTTVVSSGANRTGRSVEVYSEVFRGSLTYSDVVPAFPRYEYFQGFTVGRVEERDQAVAVVRPRPRQAPRVRGRSRQRELEWIRRNRDALRQHLGKWIVIEGNALVAAEYDYGVALRTAKGAGIRVPFIFKLTEEPTLTGLD